MAQQPFFRSIDIKNYRGIERLRIDSFAPINLIGGFNGAGKSSVLEALFASIDFAGPLSLIRPLQWRSLPPSIAYAHDAIFGVKKDKPIELKVRTRDGSYEQVYRWEPQTLRGEIELPKDLPQSGEGTTGGMGVTLSVFRNKNLILRRGFIDTPTGLAVNDRTSANLNLPQGVMLSRGTVNIQNDLADRLSKIIRARRKQEVLTILRLVAPDATDIQLLHVGGQSLVYIEIQEETLIPLSLAGDGASTLMAIALALIDSPDGAIFIDEFDAAIHYSQLKKIWSMIGRIAVHANCQIFAATHSRECIDAAVHGVSSGVAPEAIQYIRLDKVDTKTVGTSYSYSELVNADQEDWEVR